MFTVELRVSQDPAAKKTVQAATIAEAANTILEHIADHVDGTAWTAGLIRNGGGVVVARVSFNGRDWLVDSTILACPRCGKEQGR